MQITAAELNIPIIALQNTPDIHSEHIRQINNRFNELKFIRQIMHITDHDHIIRQMVSQVIDELPELCPGAAVNIQDTVNGPLPRIHKSHFSPVIVRTFDIERRHRIDIFYFLLRAAFLRKHPQGVNI